ncbi:hypothetical protein PAPYR_9019 [Paratrimastix pyriformis]|uniref:RING-type domain-containing protein n=1 Tax=Paratrimastix pyriformis TaxID=342808 RepID=A0ABQ8U9G4_9EUKA|nr:hypothetical protein PAPYR_9019 [Paratrimastix pyriformis]
MKTRVFFERDTPTLARLLYIRYVFRSLLIGRVIPSCPHSPLPSSCAICGISFLKEDVSYEHDLIPTPHQIRVRHSLNPWRPPFNFLWCKGISFAPHAVHITVHARPAAARYRLSSDGGASLTLVDGVPFLVTDAYREAVFHRVSRLFHIHPPPLVEHLMGTVAPCIPPVPPSADDVPWWAYRGPRLLETELLETIGRSCFEGGNYYVAHILIRPVLVDPTGESISAAPISDLPPCSLRHGPATPATHAHAIPTYHHPQACGLEHDYFSQEFARLSPTRDSVAAPGTPYYRSYVPEVPLLDAKTGLWRPERVQLTNLIVPIRSTRIGGPPGGLNQATIEQYESLLRRGHMPTALSLATTVQTFPHNMSLDLCSQSFTCGTVITARHLLIDGHHKLRAAARLGVPCGLLVFFPMRPLEPRSEFFREMTNRFVELIADRVSNLGAVHNPLDVTARLMRGYAQFPQAVLVQRTPDQRVSNRPALGLRPAWADVKFIHHPIPPCVMLVAVLGVPLCSAYARLRAAYERYRPPGLSDADFERITGPEAFDKLCAQPLAATFGVDGPAIYTLKLGRLVNALISRKKSIWRCLTAPLRRAGGAARRARAATGRSPVPRPAAPPLPPSMQFPLDDDELPAFFTRAAEAPPPPPPPPQFPEPLPLFTDSARSLRPEEEHALDEFLLGLFEQPGVELISPIGNIDPLVPLTVPRPATWRGPSCDPIPLPLGRNQLTRGSIFLVMVKSPAHFKRLSGAGISCQTLCQSLRSIVNPAWLNHVFIPASLASFPPHAGQDPLPRLLRDAVGRLWSLGPALPAALRHPALARLRCYEVDFGPFMPQLAMDALLANLPQGPTGESDHEPPVDFDVPLGPPVSLAEHPGEEEGRSSTPVLSSVRISSSTSFPSTHVFVRVPGRVSGRLLDGTPSVLLSAEVGEQVVARLSRMFRAAERSNELWKIKLRGCPFFLPPKIMSFFDESNFSASARLIFIRYCARSPLSGSPCVPCCPHSWWPSKCGLCGIDYRAENVTPPAIPAAPHDLRVQFSLLRRWRPLPPWRPPERSNFRVTQVDVPQSGAARYVMHEFEGCQIDGEPFLAADEAGQLFMRVNRPFATHPPGIVEHLLGTAGPVGPSTPSKPDAAPWWDYTGPRLLDPAMLREIGAGCLEGGVYDVAHIIVHPVFVDALKQFAGPVRGSEEEHDLNLQERARLRPTVPPIPAPGCPYYRSYAPEIATLWAGLRPKIDRVQVTNVIVPIRDVASLDPGIVRGYEAAIRRGHLPTALSLAVCPVTNPDSFWENRCQRPHESDALAALHHVLIDGHHKIHAAARLGAPCGLLVFIKRERRWRNSHLGFADGSYVLGHLARMGAAWSPVARLRRELALASPLVSPPPRCHPAHAGLHFVSQPQPPRLLLVTLVGAPPSRALDAIHAAHAPYVSPEMSSNDALSAVGWAPHALYIAAAAVGEGPEAVNQTTRAVVRALVGRPKDAYYSARAIARVHGIFDQPPPRADPRPSLRPVMAPPKERPPPQWEVGDFFEATAASPRPQEAATPPPPPPLFAERGLTASEREAASRFLRALFSLPCVTLASDIGNLDPAVPLIAPVPEPEPDRTAGLTADDTEADEPVPSRLPLGLDQLARGSAFLLRIDDPNRYRQLADTSDSCLEVCQWLVGAVDAAWLHQAMSAMAAPAGSPDIPCPLDPLVPLVRSAVGRLMATCPALPELLAHPALTSLAPFAESHAVPLVPSCTLDALVSSLPDLTMDSDQLLNWFGALDDDPPEPAGAAPPLDRHTAGRLLGLPPLPGPADAQTPVPPPMHSDPAPASPTAVIAAPALARPSAMHCSCCGAPILLAPPETPPAQCPPFFMCLACQPAQVLLCPHCWQMRASWGGVPARTEPTDEPDGAQECHLELVPADADDEAGGWGRGGRGRGRGGRGRGGRGRGRGRGRGSARSHELGRCRQSHVFLRVPGREVGAWSGQFSWVLSELHGTIAEESAAPGSDGPL